MVGLERNLRPVIGALYLLHLPVIGDVCDIHIVPGLSCWDCVCQRYGYGASEIVYRIRTNPEIERYDCFGFRNSILHSIRQLSFNGCFGKLLNRHTECAVVGSNHVRKNGRGDFNGNCIALNLKSEAAVGNRLDIALLDFNSVFDRD